MHWAVLTVISDARLLEKQDTSLVSIVMPIFNERQHLADSLASIASQTHRNWELVAIDDGSTDGSASIVKDFAAEVDQIVRVLSTRNIGPAGARNAGVVSSQGYWIALMDADDIWNPTKIEKQLRHSEQHSEIVASTCYFALGLDNTAPINSFNWSDAEVLRWAALEGLGPGLCSTLFMRRSAFLNLGGFNDVLRVAEDTEFALRILMRGTVSSVPESLMSYRLPQRTKYGALSQSLIVGCEYVIQLPPYSTNKRLARQVLSNCHTFIALKAFSEGRFLFAIQHLIHAARYSALGVVRYVLVTVGRKWASISPILRRR